ncbi:MAG: putative toxin-antitoxin system toxin component, PIN family [Burkholderiaceae bacterium]
MEAILDTNVWLAWLVYDDPVTRRLGAAAEAGEIILPALPRIRDEFERVLAYPRLRLELARRKEALRRFDRHARMDLPVPATDLTCSDPDDQVFLDLALHRRAGWLLSRDRGLLALRRRALARGLRIARPEDEAWQARLRRPGGSPDGAIP